MNWRSQVWPLWAKPAANGPWYQVVSNPVIPVLSLSRTPTAKWATSGDATAIATAAEAQAGGS